MPAIDGLLLVDKPAGVTSHDVVAVVRRTLGVRRVGHAGTLDPFATGLLVMLVGRATRLLPYLEGEPKVYDATVQFGTETDTDDVTGTAVRWAPAPEADAVDRAIAGLTGPLDQVPPAYSAKQVGGRRAYAAARQGEALTLEPARIVVHQWRIRERRSDALDVTITCGGGTYVRALARDLGRSSGSAAHLSALRRVRSGPFDVAGARAPDALGDARSAVQPPRAAVPSLPSVVLGPDDARRIGRGQDIARTFDAPRAALVTADGALLAVAVSRGETWQPRVVLADA